MLPDSFALVGAVIGSLGGLYYVVETLLGRAQPNRITWLLWGIFPLIIFGAQRVQGVKGISWVSLVSGVMPLLVLAASFFNDRAYWKSAPRDYSLMGAAILGMILWAATDNANLALLCALAADVLASVPTVVKAYHHPHSESCMAYTVSTIGFGMGLLSVRTITVESTAFVAYVFLLNGTLALLSSRGRTPSPGRHPTP